MSFPEWPMAAEFQLNKERDAASKVGNHALDPQGRNGHRPTISVGLPVYNGERYLQESIDSILAQTYTDFELIISDNASTDGTEEICRRYAAGDARVRYHRNQRNIGGGQNHCRVFSLAMGKYFRFAAHDDVCAPQLFAHCLEALELHPEAVLSYPIIVRIDAEGRSIGEIRQQKGAAPEPHVRFEDLTAGDHDCAIIYGLIRSDVLADIERKTGLLPPYSQADRTLLGQLSLYGPFVQVVQPLFSKRYHPAMSIGQFPGGRERMAWYRPPDEDPISLPFWQEFLHYLRVIGTAPLSPAERLRCYRRVLRWLSVERGWGKLLKDLYYAGLKLLRSTTARRRHERIEAR
jgi:glycosyltransferase involved in cell wall biosynthesis